MGRSVIGRHVYAGGFMLGVQRVGWEPIAALESWEDPAPLFYRVLPGVLRVKRVDDKADIVIGNPPCSRFSHMSFDKFNCSDRSNLDNFPELMSVLQAGIHADAHTVWWETGPLAFTSGDGIIAGAHNMLKFAWGECNTLEVLFDTAWAGVPQQRPRTHIIHTKYPVPSSLLLPEKRTVQDRGFDNVHRWIERDTAGNAITGKLVDNRWIGKHDSIAEYIRYGRMHTEKGFNATKPLLISRDDLVVNAIVSGRLYAWKEDQRWWELPEYASVMGYPTLEEVNYYEVAKNPMKTLMFLAKSVSPCASEWVAQHIVEQIFAENWEQQQCWLPYRQMTPSIVCDGVSKLDLGTGTRVHKLRSHTRGWL